MRKYAIVLTTDAAYLPGATALFNGLALYGNDIDVHFLPTEDVPQSYLAQLPPDQFTIIDWNTLPVDRVQHDGERGLPWQVRFFRYWYAAKICTRYEAVMIMDSDAMILGDISEPFDWVAANQGLAMVRNPYGLSPDLPPELFHKANQPPFHSHCATYAPVHHKLLDGIFEWGLAHPWGDMVSLHQVLQKSGHDFSKIYALPNERWCHTWWWDQPVARYEVAGLPVLMTYDSQRLLVVHGKWFNPDYLDKECERATHCGESAPFYKVDIDGRRNVELYRNIYNWLNANGPYKLPILSTEEEQG